MRTGKAYIAGTEYPTCFNTRVVIACEDRAGNVNAVLSAVDAGSVKDTMWLLAQMIDAGIRYERNEGREAPDPVTYEQLIDITDPDDYDNIILTVVSTVTAGSERRIEAKPGKNAKASRGE